MRRNADVAGDGPDSLSADEPLPHARSSGLVKTWCFLSVAKASIPSQEIGSHYIPVEDALRRIEA